MSVLSGFVGVEWATLDVQADGSIIPPPKTVNRDKLKTLPCPQLAQNVYCVVNLNKGYNTLVQLRRYGPLKQGRCNNPDCVKWRVRACKHIRAAVKWHVKFNRRVHRLKQQRESWAKELATV